MNQLRADLHIHTALSPCASDEMTPPAIVRAAAAKGVSMIAICDHNSTGNSLAVQRAAEQARAAVTVLAGMEVTSAEEVHVLALFGSTDAALAADAEVRATLPPQSERSRRLGPQVRLDVSGRVIGEESAMLSAATTFSLEHVVRLIKRHGGLAVASHVDRPSFSVTSQLGFFPADAGLDAIEVSPFLNRDEAERHYGKFGLPILGGSDSHFLADIGTCCSTLTAAAATFAELELAIRGERGRRIART